MARFEAFIISIISISCFPKTAWCAYSSNTFKINSDSENLVIPEGGIKSRKDVFVVLNVGVVPVWVVVQTKSWELGEFYDRAAEYLEPLKQSQVPVPVTKGQPFYQLLIRNREDTAALVYAAVNNKFNPNKNRNGGSSYLNINTNALLKSVATFGAGYIPVVGGALSAILDFFWPVATADVWSQVSEKVEAMIGEKTIELVSNLLSSKVRRFSRRLQGLNMEINMREENDSKIHIANHYLNLAQDMFGLEEDFVFDRYSPKTKKMNFQLLPYYVKVISLLVEVYNFGITHQELLGLDNYSIRSLKMYRDATLFTRHTGAVDYIHQKLVFDECPDAEEIYNCMANVRNYVTMNGLDYINRWIQSPIAKEQTNTSYSCNSYFSMYLGRPSVQMNVVGSRPYVARMFRTEYFNGSCSRMVMVKFHRCRGVFCGMETFFNDGKEHMMGKVGDHTTKMQLETRTLRKLEVFGSSVGSVAGLGINFFNGKGGVLGKTGPLLGTFEMEGYYISVIMVTHGMNIEKNGIAKIAVSYLPHGG